MAFDDYLQVLGLGKYSLPAEENLVAGEESGIPSNQATRLNYEGQFLPAETTSMPKVPGRYSLPPTDFAPEQPGDSNIPYQDRPDYKQSIKKNSIISDLTNILSTKGRAPAVENTVHIEPTAPYQAQDALGGPQAELDAALADREKNMRNAALRGSAADFANAAMTAWGIDKKITPGYAHEELKRAEDLKLKDLNEQMALSGKVLGSEKAKIDLDDMAAMSDPNSPGSQALRDNAAKFLGADKDPKMAQMLAGMSGAQIQKLLGRDLAGIISGMEERELRREQAEGQREDRRLARENQAEISRLNREARADLRQDKIDDKSKADTKKKEDSMAEVEDRRRNIDDNLNKLSTMINRDGTWELMGSHNQDLDRLVDTIATDMAKLTDPKSVARPAEVDLWRKNLVESGFKNMNSSAQDIIKNFKKEVEDRTEHAYVVRGLKDPGFNSKYQNKGSKSISRKQYSPSRNQTKIIYSDGSEEILDGQK